MASWENGTTLDRVQHELIPKAGGESKISYPHCIKISLQFAGNETQLTIAGSFSLKIFFIIFLHLVMCAYIAFLRKELLAQDMEIRTVTCADIHGNQTQTVTTSLS